MTLSAGTRIGPYEILQFTGAGGMGEVYRARDSRLNRDVALKFLPDGGRHAEALDRFRREAHALAALNHANIATIHGFEEAGDHRALVMEFVEGRTLADVIAGLRTGPAGAAGSSLSLPEALAIGRQVADALEAAHEHGIVHRDLKPANIMIRPDGVVKVLDFGLAKALRAAPADAVAAGEVPAESPTVASPAVTHAGVVVGTAAFMSPEQARGGLVDKRADIWAFGVVLYEMVTGRRLFQGRHVTDVLAAVVGETPDLSAAPAQVRRLLEKCLEKDPRRRLRDISAAALLLDDAVTSTATPVRTVGTSWKKKAVYFAGLTALVAAAVVATAMFVWRTPAAPPAVEFSMEPPAGTSFANLYIGSALSPDGQHMVFSAAPSGQAPSLWLRRLGSVDARMLPSTARAFCDPLRRRRPPPPRRRRRRQVSVRPASARETGSATVDRGDQLGGAHRPVERRRGISRHPGRAQPAPRTPPERGRPPAASAGSTSMAPRSGSKCFLVLYSEPFDSESTGLRPAYSSSGHSACLTACHERTLRSPASTS